MNEKIKKRLKRTGILCFAALIIGGGIGLVEIQQQKNATVIGKGETPKPMAGIKIGGPFELIDQDGAIVTEKSFEGKYKLIYFGFTFCPAICPTELAKITKALNALGADGGVIQPIFITVDPERDTKEVMKSYISLFHPRLTGLTGPKDKVDDVLKSYRIYAAKAAVPGTNEYTVNHSSFIYFIGPDGELISIYRTEDTAEKMAEEIAHVFSIRKMAKDFLPKPF